MSYKQSKENDNTTRIKTHKLHCFSICSIHQILSAKHLSLRKAFFLQPVSFTIVFKLSIPGSPGAIRAIESYLEAEKNTIHLISLWRDTHTTRGEGRGKWQTETKEEVQGKTGQDSNLISTYGSSVCNLETTQPQNLTTPDCHCYINPSTLLF